MEDKKKVIEIDEEKAMEFDQEKAMEALEGGLDKAEEILKDEDKLERLLQRAERKLRVIPRVGDILAVIPVYISLLRSYIAKEYTDVPIGSLLAIISTVAYIVLPIDLIPDFIPGAGYIDDAAVVLACMKLVKDDVNEYLSWRGKNGKNIEE